MKLNPRLLKAATSVRILLILSIFLGLSGGVIGILQARQISRIINRVFLMHESLQAVTELIVIILLIIVLRILFGWASEVCAGVAAQRLKQSLRQRLVAHIFDLGPAYLRTAVGETQARTGELVTLATEGMDALEVYFSQYLPQLALAALIPISILIFVFPVDTLSGIIFLVTAPLLPVFMNLIGNAAQNLTRKQWQGLSRMEAYFLDVLQGLTTLKLLGRSLEQIGIVHKVSERYRRSTMSVLKVTFLSALALELIATLSTAVVAVEIGIRLLYGKLAFEQAFFLLLLAPEFYQPLRMLGTRFHAGMAGVEAAQSFFAILDLQAFKTPSPQTAQEKPRQYYRSAPSISIRDLSYSYSGGHKALDGISFDLPPGKLTALVGESGAGKSTLAWLLMGFLQPMTGRILVDGHPIEGLTSAEWLGKLAYVSQNPYLFNDTILANLRLARPDADEATIQTAAQMAHAQEFIEQLPLGYQTQVGERGVRLSAGQAQRIALARAFLKDTPFLILDEATSYLDPESEALVRESMQRLFVGRTVLVIAHHSNTLSMAHQLVTLSRGKVKDITVNHSAYTAYPMISSEPQAQIHPHPTLGTPSTSGHDARPEGTTTHRMPVEIRLLRLISPFLGRIFLSVLLGFATVASGVGLMATAAYIISAAALHPSIADLQVAIVGVRFFGLSRGIFRYLERLVSHDTTFRLLAHWREGFYQALEPLAPARLISYHSGDLLTRVISDINSLENFYVRSVAPPLVAFLVALATILFLGGFSGQLAWGLLAIILLAAIGLPLLSLAFSRKLGPKIIQERARLTVYLVDGFQGMVDILTSEQVSAYRARAASIGEQLGRHQLRMSVFTASQNALGNLLSSLGMLTILVLAIPMVSQGYLNGVLVGVVTIAALTCFEAFLPLPQVAQNYSANRAAAARLYELVDAPLPVAEPCVPLELLGTANLEVQQLSFQYPEWPEAVPAPSTQPFGLHEISFSLPLGKHIALIGPSGAGKSTLINILLRFWEYPQGSIAFAGRELRQYRQRDICKQIAVMPQNPYLFSATIRENLLIARPQATDDDIAGAARLAQLHDFIQTLPEAYNTWIGEHGLRLSAGERQRLALARALLMNTPLLILDEPTANLDPSTSQAMLQSIRSATQGRSTITVTQSMVDLEGMEEILVLQNGHIIERGTHDQLLTQRGLYSRMWGLYHQSL